MINKEKIFITRRLKEKSLFIFFEKVLTQFHRELEILSQQWYIYEGGIDGNPGYNDVFALIERSYVGLFNNAVIRSFPLDAALQEFSVHLGGRKYIRCDYLVKHWDGKNSIDILFEAKSIQFNGKEYSTEDSKQFFAPFIEQGEKYYQIEEKYYLGTCYVSCLVFEWVRKKKHVEQVLNWKDLEDGITDFFCFYHSDVAGLMVYGNLKKVK